MVGTGDPSGHQVAELMRELEQSGDYLEEYDFVRDGAVTVVEYRPTLATFIVRDRSSGFSVDWTQDRLAPVESGSAGSWRNVLGYLRVWLHAVQRTTGTRKHRDLMALMLLEPRIERSLAALCTHGTCSWAIVEQARPLFSLHSVRRHLPPNAHQELDYAAAVRAHLEDALLSIESFQHRVILEVVLGLGDARWKTDEWRNESAETRRAQAGQLVHGADGALTGDAIMRLHEPRAVGELTKVIYAHERHGVDRSWHGILGPDGLPVQPGSDPLNTLVSDVRLAIAPLVDSLSSRPERVHALTARQFEEVVAELLHKRGYCVTLTPASRDGGVDIFAAKREALGSFLYVVECKRYSADNHVGVGLIRELLGVVTQHRATAGVLATTSFFTAGAKDLQRSMRWQLSLRDYDHVAAWLQNQTLDF
jgi:Restriction endonuclease